MKRIGSSIVAALLCALVAREAAAQWNVARYQTQRAQVYTTFGLDPAFITSVGLAKVASLTGHDVQFSGEAGVVAAHMDTRDFRTRFGVRTSLYRWKSVSVTGSAMAIVRGTENTVYRAINFGADFTGAAGVYRPRWFAAGEFGKDKAIITRLRNSDWYRENVYRDAKNGWYLDAGGTFHYGVAGGLALGRAELSGRFGLLRTEKFGEMMPPFYGSVGVGLGF